jgi:hypothetical protein
LVAILAPTQHQRELDPLLEILAGVQIVQRRLSMKVQQHLGLPSDYSSYQRVLISKVVRQL